MKKIVILIVTGILITISSHAHQAIRVNQGYCLTDTIVSLIKDYNYYKQKSAGQKTGAWFLVAGGSISILIASAMTVNDTETQLVNVFSLEETPKSDNREKTEKIFLFVGLVALLGSIPLFIAGRRNKLKARLSMQNEKLSSLLPGSTAKYTQGITLTIPIGKQ